MTKRLLKSVALMVPTASLAAPAFGHAGGHGHMPLLEIVQHLSEPDHLAVLALTSAVGWLAYRVGRRAEARVRANGRDNAKDRQ